MAGFESKFTEEIAEKVCKMARFGMTDKDIASVLDISVETILDWQEAHPNFKRDLKKAKNKSDKKVEDALYFRALGYQHPETKVNYDAKLKKHITCEVTKHYPPDVAAIIFWLKNRHPDRWKDRREVDINDTVVKIENKRFDGGHY